MVFLFCIRDNVPYEETQKMLEARALAYWGHDWTGMRWCCGELRQAKIIRNIKAPTKCTSEENQGPVGKAPSTPNKWEGKRKLATWMETVNSVLETEKESLSSQQVALLTRIAKHRHVPKKTESFRKFVNKSSGLGFDAIDAATVDAVWDLLESERDKARTQAEKRKKTAWMETVKSVLENGRQSLSPQQVALLTMIAKNDNLPKKKEKFRNIRKSIRFDEATADSVWKVLEAERDKLQTPAKEENGPHGKAPSRRNKWEEKRKQTALMETVKSVLETGRNSLSPLQVALLSMIAKHDNLPTEKEKFRNLVNKSIRFDVATVDAVWDYLKAERDKSQTPHTETSNGESALTEAENNVTGTANEANWRSTKAGVHSGGLRQAEVIKSNKAPTKCISDEENGHWKSPRTRYKLEGKRKLATWMETVKSVLETEKESVSSQQVALLTMIAKHRNVPKKTESFRNFVKSSGFDAATVDAVWDLLESEREEENDPHWKAPSSQNKWERKKAAWMKIIKSVVETEKESLSSQQVALLTMIAKHRDVPMKKGKFRKFVNKSSGLGFDAIDAATVDAVWDYLKAEGDKLHTADTETSNGESALTESGDNVTGTANEANWRSTKAGLHSRGAKNDRT